MDVLSLKRCSDGMNNNLKFKNNTTTADTDTGVPHRQWKRRAVNYFSRTKKRIFDFSQEIAHTKE